MSSLGFQTAGFDGWSRDANLFVERGTVFAFFPKDFYLFIFREGRREGEREKSTHVRERNQSYNRTSDPSLCRTAPNQLSHPGQGKRGSLK